MESNIIKLAPQLETNDLIATIEFYENKLGFTCIGKLDTEWANLKSGNISIMFQSRFETEKYPNPILTGGIYIYVNRIDEIWNRLKGKCEVCYPLETFDYGMREFSIYDNNSYRLQFGEEIHVNKNVKKAID